MFDAIKIVAGAVLGIGVMAGPVYLYGKSAGRTEAAAASVARSVEVLRQRGKIDEQISSADVSALCGHLGLQDDERAECVRRLTEANAQP